MDTTLTDALRTKYEALKADFGSKAAERLREVVEHALEQIAGRAGARPVRPAKAAPSSGVGAGGGRGPGRRSWTPAQRAEQRKKMQAYWATRQSGKPRKAKGKASGGTEGSAAS